MSCCGGKRAALMAKSAYARSQKNLYAQPSPAGKAEQTSPATGPLVEYVGTGSLSLRGPVSGQVYIFKESGVSSIVHEHDLNALLSTGLFSRVKV